ncbi:MAG: hypothetical protein ACI8XO_003260 [Verrucomicrobiales bacterium]|jgi:hypothetical protein
MKSFKLLAALLLAPLLFALTANADDKDKNEEVKSKKPSLTYYYFDG